MQVATAIVPGRLTGLPLFAEKYFAVNFLIRSFYIGHYR
jgi:hypothetical protein